MSAPTIGSLCSGYGGLDMAVEEFFGAETAWFSEFDAAPSKVLAHHWPDVPNLGDMTVVDWASVPRVDIVTGGTPCQDLSAAGRRRGMTEGTRSNLWVQMRECIAAVRPSVVVWENVRGALSAYATSEVESEQGLLGESYGPDRPALRAILRVLGDLAELGFDAELVPVRASDAGAPHGRYRVFVVAVDTSVQHPGYGSGSTQQGHQFDTHDGPWESGEGVAYAERGGRAGWSREAGWVAGRRTAVERSGEGVAPVKPAADTGYDGRGRADGARTTGEPSAFPVEDSDVAARGERRESAPGQTQRGRARSDTGRRSGTPTADTGRECGERRGTARDMAGTSGEGEADRAERERHGNAADDSGDPGVAWGDYEPAIRRWERTLGRVAPAPTNPDGKGAAHRLAPEFVEWMMGLPAGHVTAPEIGLSRNEQLKALGNGVVPQQALLALSIAWPRLADVRKAVAA